MSRGNNRIKMTLKVDEYCPKELIFESGNCFYCQKKINKELPQKIIPLMILEQHLENGELKSSLSDDFIIKDISLPYCEKHQISPAEDRKKANVYNQLIGLFTSLFIVFILNTIIKVNNDRSIQIWSILLLVAAISQIIALIGKKVYIKHKAKTNSELLDHPFFVNGFEGFWGIFIKSNPSFNKDYAKYWYANNKITYKIPIEISNLKSAKAFATQFAKWISISPQNGISENLAESINSEHFDSDYADYLAGIESREKENRAQAKQERALAKIRKQKIAAAYTAAENWWNVKLAPGKEPEDPPHNDFICDSCNSIIEKREGTGLVGSWMYCKNCMDRMIKDKKKYFVE